MSTRYEMRLSGFGGQGLIFAGIVLAEAIGIHEGKYVCQTQSYGPEARGGKSRADIVASDEPIDYPKPISLDLLLAMSQDACDNFFIDLNPDGIMIVDSTFVKETPISKAIRVPCTEIAKKTGDKVVANIVALGVISQYTDVVSIPSLKKALGTIAPKGSEKLNVKALNAGVRAAKKIIDADEE